MAFNYATWMDLTRRGRFILVRNRRSPALTDVDTWFKRYEDSGKTNKNHLRRLSDAFSTWSNTKMREETRGPLPTQVWNTKRNKIKDPESGKGAAQLLAEYIRQQSTADLVIKKNVTGLDERVALIEDAAAPMSVWDRRKIDETIRVLQAAVRQARDKVIKARGGGAERALFVKWFGAWDEARWTTVRGRFMTLDKICSDEGIIFEDGRSDPDGAGAYAWAMQGYEERTPKMWLGGPFFVSNIGAAKARKAYGDTLGTLVHELTHACFFTGDIPVNAAAPRDADLSATDYDGELACNDPRNNCILASTVGREDEAVANADNYGEFVVDVYSKIEFRFP